MDLFLAICLGIGLALAVGMRPFLPALLIGALARGDAGIDFEHTDVAFLEQPAFLLALVVAVIVLVAADRRLGPERVREGPLGAAVGGIELALGALMFGGALADDGYALWPGLIAGIACAALATTVVRNLATRTSARLDADAARALPLYFLAAALALAGLTVLAPPVGLLGLAFFAWLFLSQRRREGRKHAGLRILR